MCSSALVEDLYRVMKKTPPSERTLVLLGRSAVLVVALIAMAMAINPNDTILGLVSFAWAGFGASFGPVILLSLYWRKLTVPRGASRHDLRRGDRVRMVRTGYAAVRATSRLCCPPSRGDRRQPGHL